MKKFFKKLLTVSMAAALAVAGAGCAATAKDKEKEYKYIDLTAPVAEKSSEAMVSFQSSDTEFNNFINDYAHRHMRYDNERIGAMTVADNAAVMFEREWDSLALSWFDSTAPALPQNNMGLLKNWLSRVAVDKFGYVWMTGEGGAGGGMTTPDFFMQGWPFPQYNQSYGETPGFEFNGTDTQDWTCNVAKAQVANGFYAFSDTLSADAVYENANLNVNTEQSPFLEVAISINSSDTIGKNSNVDDIYVYWKRKGDTDYSESRMIKQSEFSTMNSPVTSSFSKALFLPMYLHPEWGTNTDISAVKIVIRPKAGKSMKIESRLNYVRFNYDTRQSANAALLLTAARNYYEFTRDYEDLKKNLTRYRSAMQFMLTHLKGESGLLDLGYFVGHDGLVYDDEGERALGHGIGDNYWDILSLPQINLSSNVYFNKALCAMRDLEMMAERQNIQVAKPSVKGATDWKADVAYSQTVQSLNALIELSKQKISEYFWNEKTGRLHLGFNKDDSEPVDYGYVVFNLEAIAEGVVEGEKAESIMDWISGKRIVAGDTSTGADIYKFEFAPRTSTLRNPIQYVWPWNPRHKPFGRQVQDGGSVLWSSYYDIVARLKVYGADNAWARFKEIQTWYEKVKAAGGNGLMFYREYYNELGLEDPDYSLQGGGTDGGLGLDEEFIENAILYAAIPLGFMGLNGREAEVLTVSPQLPQAFEYFEIENLMYNGLKYDMAVTNLQVTIGNVRGVALGASVKLKFKAGEGFDIYVNGAKVKSEREGEYITAVVPFGAFSAEAKK